MNDELKKLINMLNNEDINLISKLELSTSFNNENSNLIAQNIVYFIDKLIELGLKREEAVKISCSYLNFMRGII